MPDIRVLLIVVAALATSLLVCLALIGYLAANGLAVPDVLLTTTGGIVGMLGGLLVDSRSSPRGQ